MALALTGLRLTIYSLHNQQDIPALLTFPPRDLGGKGKTGPFVLDSTQPRGNPGGLLRDGEVSVSDLQ